MYPESGYHKAALTVISRWPRIKTLHVNLMCDLIPGESAIRDVSQVILDGLFDVLSVPNPDIEELTLAFKTTVLERFWLTVHFPPGLCTSRHFPKLREIELENCNLPHSPTHWPPFGSCLRVLKLMNTKAWPDIDSAIQCLQATPLLKVFECKYDNYRQDEDVEIQLSRIHQPRCMPFPYLRDLILKGLWIENITIFKHIAAPSSCNFTLGSSMWDDEEVPELSESALHVLVATTRESLTLHLAPASSQGAVFDCVRFEEAELIASNLPNDTSYSGLPPPSITIFPPRLNSKIERHALFEASFSHSVFTQARCLSFNAYFWDFFPQHYDAYKNVREIMLSCADNLDTFASALSEKGAALFPKLTRVVVEQFQNDHGNWVMDLMTLVRALCSAHGASEQFESLVIPDGIVSRDVLDDVRKKIGRNRLCVGPS